MKGSQKFLESEKNWRGWENGNFVETGSSEINFVRQGQIT